jgi:hypothetical protein
MAMAGHSNFATRKRYIDLAEVTFTHEVDKLEKFFGSGTKTQVPSVSHPPQNVLVSR